MRRCALAAVETAIVHIREERPVPSSVLVTICQAVGEPAEFLTRRRHSAFTAVQPSAYRRLLALVVLEDLAQRLREGENL